MTKQTSEVWTFGIKKKHSEISQEYLISCQGKSAVSHSWDLPGLYGPPRLVLFHFCPTEPGGTIWGHVAWLRCWASKTLSEEILTALDTTSILFIISLMKDHFAEILRVEGHSCFLSPHIYMRGKVTLGGTLGNSQ